MGDFTSGSLVLCEFVPASDAIRLIRDVVYIDDDGREWIAPAGMESDGSSQPPITWPVLGHPFKGVRLKPALIHDSAYQCAPPWEATILKAMRSEDRAAADLVFLEGMRDEGDDQCLAVYRGVRLFGWWAWYWHARANKRKFLLGE